MLTNFLVWVSQVVFVSMSQHCNVGNFQQLAVVPMIKKVGGGWCLTTAPVTKTIRLSEWVTSGDTAMPGMTSLKDRDFQHSSALAQSSNELIWSSISRYRAPTIQSKNSKFNPKLDSHKVEKRRSLLVILQYRYRRYDQSQAETTIASLPPYYNSAWYQLQLCFPGIVHDPWSGFRLHSVRSLSELLSSRNFRLWSRLKFKNMADEGSSLGVQRNTWPLFPQDGSSSAVCSSQLMTRLLCRISVGACVTERSQCKIHRLRIIILWILKIFEIREF